MKVLALKFTGTARAPILVASFVLLLMAADLHAAAPVVSNIRASQRPGTKLVDIYYDLTAVSASVSITATVSADGGLTYGVPAATFTGHYGAGVASGANRSIVWNAGADWPSQFSSQCRVRVIADDAVPNNMALVPAGSFLMGDPYVQGGSDERPLHNVTVSSFYMDRFEVTWAFWQQVRDWAAVQGYSFVNPGSGRGSTHPVHSVNWFDTVKWCNARSQMDGLAPVYYADAAFTTLYKSGEGIPYAKWSANGYRLPTEAEWEKAARGGLAGTHFPWPGAGGSYSTYINGSKANYYQSGDPFEGGNPATTPVGYYNGAQTPAGVDMANGYGLYDMAGNIWEWCWDWYDGAWYSNPGATQGDTRGPVSGTSRGMRGGVWVISANYLRCAQRYSNSPTDANFYFGFRCVRGL